MKLKLRCGIIFVLVLVFSGLLYMSVCGASTNAYETAETTHATSSSEPSQAPETTKDNSTKQWIFFGVTSVLSLAIAIPLAIRSGNKKYGK